MSAEILINVRPNLTRVAYIEDNELTDLKIEKRTQPTTVGSIYKGEVLRVLPGMQAAFVNIGLGRSGFLYVGDILENIQANQLDLAEDKADELGEEGGESSKVLNRPYKIPIQNLLKAGDEIMVQVAKDPLGTKGARLTTQISLPGRQIVYMPKVEHIGVSRKIESESEKDRLKKIAEGLKPKGGMIIRTAGEGINKEDLQLDLDYLYRVWDEIEKNYSKRKSVGLVFSDVDIELRALRDLLNDRVKRVLVDDKKVHRKITQFVGQFLPDFKSKLKLYQEPKPLFDMYDIDLEITRSLERKIWLKSGGYIVFDEAEALVVVDVNTGRFVGKKDLEDTILKTNLEAAREITHQLRIRNCGGIIILDLIDMESAVNQQKVLDALEADLKKDRAKTAVISMSDLGLVEMTRKRIRPSLVSTLCEPCPYCDGKAYTKRPNTVANEIFRALERQSTVLKKDEILISHCHPTVADWIYEEESDTLDELEAKLGFAVVFKVESSYHIEQYDVRTLNKTLLDGDEA